MIIKKEKKSGGIRAGAGRKKTDDKIIPVYIGIRESVINSYGGKNNVKFLAEEFINVNSIV